MNTLADLLAGGPLDADGLAALVRSLAQELARRHQEGQTHAALSPAAIELADGAGARLAAGAPDPDYTAPELTAGAPGTPAGDVWSLGATAFRASEGRAPGVAEQRAWHAGPFAAVIEAMLQPDPSRRPTADEVAARFGAPVALAQPPGLEWAQPPVTEWAPQPPPAATSPQSAVSSPGRRRAVTRAVLLAWLAVAVGGIVLVALLQPRRGGAGQATTAAAPPPAASTRFDQARHGVASPSGRQGGTMRLLATTDCDSWDPGNTYATFCWNLQRIFTRTLVGHRVGPDDTSELVPDLAVDLGAHDASYRTWTYHLKPGLRYANGAPISARDIKHAMSRLFATDVLRNGPSVYYTSLLLHPVGYRGFYRDGELPTVQTPDDRTITFHLGRPFAEFDQLMALPASAPVPTAADDGAGYTRHPMSSGPFRLESYDPGAAVVFSRNPYFAAGTDPVVRPLADRIVLMIDTDPTDVDRQLRDGAADAAVNVGASRDFRNEIDADPALKANADNPPTHTVLMWVLYPGVPELRDVHCRRAVAYALDKRTLVSARGDAYTGDVATSLTPPSYPGFDPAADPYPNGSDHTGDLARAADELRRCGRPGGFTVRAAFPDTTTGRTQYDVTRVALSRVGIVLTGAALDSSTYYSTGIGSPSAVAAAGYGIAQAGWAPDYPTGYGFWDALVDSRRITSHDNTNLAGIADRDVDALLDATTRSGGPHDEQYRALESTVLGEAVLLPYGRSAILSYRGPRLTDVRVNGVDGGYYDVANAGVRA